MKLRTWFVLPTWVWMAGLFAAPFAIILAYSFLTRGAYGGVEQPWTLENYQRLFDPLYLIILLRSFGMALVATILCLVLAFPAALFISQAPNAQESLSATSHAAVLDELSGPHLRLAVFVAGHRTDQHRFWKKSASSTPLAFALQQRRRATGIGLWISPLHGASHLRDPGAARSVAAGSGG